MSWLVDTRAYLAARSDRIGPGRLVLVVGPSGAGKDTLIDGARAACADDSGVVFPRRVVTRPSSAAEDNETLSVDGFKQSVAHGAFALWWEAHGHCYGILIGIDDEMRGGRTVVCNVSRTIIAQARRRYALVTVVLVTAPQDVLEARLLRRGRPSDGNLAGRIGRSEDVGTISDAEVVIINVGQVKTGVRRLLNAIKDSGMVLIT